MHFDEALFNKSLITCYELIRFETRPRWKTVYVRNTRRDTNSNPIGRTVACNGEKKAPRFEIIFKRNKRKQVFKWSIEGKCREKEAKRKSNQLLFKLSNQQSGKNREFLFFHFSSFVFCLFAIIQSKTVSHKISNLRRCRLWNSSY